MPTATTVPMTAPVPADDAVPVRILQQARTHFFAHGYSRFKMDDLATELGMSKKTLYVHFAGKHEILAAVIDDLGREIRAEADSLLRNRQLNLAEKLRGFVESMAERLAAVTPGTFRDLQRHAPDLYDRLAEMREKNIPYVFGRFVEQGQIEGFVRDDLPPGFAIEFYLQAMHGLLQPAALERLRLAPREVIRSAVDLFFGGLLTPVGRKQYEKLFPR
jgi:AcrR family transcriptional regulator